MKIYLVLTLFVFTSFAFALEVVKIKNLLPTTYYTAQEKNVSCSGTYRGIDYKGNERADILTPKGEVIANVCTRFYKVLCMEGSGVLSSRGQGPISVNWAMRGRFKVQRRCRLGHGVSPRDCLLPHHTIAADLKQHKIGDIIYIPKAKGIKLPDGSIHDGNFIVLDTGGAFRGIGAQRVDLFIGLENDGKNTFRKHGFHHRKPMKAFKLFGEKRKEAFQALKEKFGELLSDRHIN